MTLNPTEKTSPLESKLKLLVESTPLTSFDLSKRPPASSAAGPEVRAQPADSVVFSEPGAALEVALKELAALVSGSPALPQLASIPPEQIAAELRALLTRAVNPDDGRKDGQPRSAPESQKALPAAGEQAEQSPAPEAVLKEMAALASDPMTLSQLATTPPEQVAMGLRALLTQPAGPEERQEEPSSTPADKPPAPHTHGTIRSPESAPSGQLAEGSFLLLTSPPAYGQLIIRGEDRQAPKKGGAAAPQTTYCVALDLFTTHIGVVRVRLALAGGNLVGTLAFPEKEWSEEAERSLAELESTLSKTGIRQTALRVMTAPTEGQ